MSVTTPHPTRPSPVAPAAAAASAVRAAIRTRRHTVGASLGALPVMNLVAMEIGLGLALTLVAVNSTLVPVAAVVLVLAVAMAFIRWRGRWFTQWIGLTVRYLTRSNTRIARISEPTAAEPATADTPSVVGAKDPRVALLRLAAPDLVVAHGIDHDRRPVGMAWSQGAWTAVLLVEPAPALVTQVGAAPNMPLGALAPCLEDRGVVLDTIQVIWHCYPGSAELPLSSPALASYLEVLGPLPAAARRTTWVVVRLDPRRCSAAIRERGGGVVGAHRALIGALSRVRSSLQSRGVPTRPLDVDELLRAGISAAELTSVAGSSAPVKLRERWTGVSAANVGHASYAIAGWPSKDTGHSLNALTGVRALSATVAMSISPSGEDGQVGLRGVVRVSARTPTELAQADRRLRTIADNISLTLTPLRGLQLSGLAATLPLGGAG